MSDIVTPRVKEPPRGCTSRTFRRAWPALRARRQRPDGMAGVRGSGSYESPGCARKPWEHLRHPIYGTGLVLLKSGEAVTILAALVRLTVVRALHHTSAGCTRDLSRFETPGVP